MVARRPDGFVLRVDPVAAEAGVVELVDKRAEVLARDCRAMRGAAESREDGGGKREDEPDDLVSSVISHLLRSLFHRHLVPHCMHFALFPHGPPYLTVVLCPSSWWSHRSRGRRCVRSLVAWL